MYYVALCQIKGTRKKYGSPEYWPHNKGMTAIKTASYLNVRRNAFARKTGRMFHIREERGKMNELALFAGESPIGKKKGTR